MNMSLWHMHSDVLKGFYASEVYVSAYNKQSARASASEAFDRYIKMMEDDLNCNFLTEDMPWDPEYPTQLSELRRRFYDETDKLEELEHLADIYHRT